MKVVYHFCVQFSIARLHNIFPLLFLIFPQHFFFFSSFVYTFGLSKRYYRFSCVCIKYILYICSMCIARARYTQLNTSIYYLKGWWWYSHVYSFYMSGTYTIIQIYQKFVLYMRWYIYIYIEDKHTRWQRHNELESIFYTFRSHGGGENVSLNDRNSVKFKCVVQHCYLYRMPFRFSLHFTCTWGKRVYRILGCLLRYLYLHTHTHIYLYKIYHKVYTMASGFWYANDVLMW